MSSGNQPDAGSSARERPETQGRGRETQSPESLEPIHESATIHQPIHEDATILGGPRIQAAEADQSAAGSGLGSITDPSEFRRAVLEFGLATEDELDGLTADVPASAGVLGLARALQKAGKLTAYQAAALYQRKSRGLLIGNYLILDKLGVGGMGVVFKARHRRLGRVVALKILPPSFARDRTALARFKREVEAAGKLKHPNIVAALDADEDRGVHFLVMEYVEGRDLDHVVRQRGPLPVVEAIEYLIQAARGLAAAHAEGIVHRDIKPSNLMLDTAGTVRVLDLGLARIVDASNPFGQAAGGRLTESGTYMGTIDYMAPEQAEDSRRADQRADVYSLGCTLYYLMTGREPFVGETVLRRLMAHQERPAPPLQGARPDAPAALERAFQRMMAKRPADRPESMTAVIALLESCKAAAALAPATHPAAAPKPRRELKVFDEAAIKRAEPGKPGREPSIFALRDQPEGAPLGTELNLEDLVMDVRSEAPLPPLPARTIRRAVKPRASGRVIRCCRGRSRLAGPGIRRSSWLLGQWPSLVRPSPVSPCCRARRGPAPTGPPTRWRLSRRMRRWRRQRQAIASSRPNWPDTSLNEATRDRPTQRAPRPASCSNRAWRSYLRTRYWLRNSLNCSWISRRVRTPRDGRSSSRSR